MELFPRTVDKLTPYENSGTPVTLMFLEQFVSSNNNVMLCIMSAKAPFTEFIKYGQAVAAASQGDFELAQSRPNAS